MTLPSNKGIVTPLNDASDVPQGFSFDNVHRNAMIEKLAQSSNSTGTSILPAAKKTGTTIAGVIFDGGVVLGADTRATGGSEVAEKNCEKIHYLAPNIYCCGAGTAADTEKTTDMVRSNLELLRMQMHGEQSRVITACTHLKRFLHSYQGHISAALVLGGCDVSGPHIYQIYPHGSTGKLPYTTMGSGSLAAMAVFESGWRSTMNEGEAIALVQRAIGAGIFNDLGSGSNCDICIIRMDGTVLYNRNMVKPNEIAPLRNAIRHSDRFVLPTGTTPVLHTVAEKHMTTMSEQFASLDDVMIVEEMEVEG
jgi:20S proteasome subunit beta 2